MTDWTAEQKSIHDDFQEEGFEITIRIPGIPGKFSEDDMAHAVGTDPVDVTTYGLKKKYNISQIDGDNIKKNDIKLIFPAYGLSPVTTDNQILIGGVVQTVIDIGVIDPGNVALVYEAQIRV